MQSDAPGDRAKKLADSIGPRIIAFGPEATPKGSSMRYMPLMVRTDDASAVLRLLTVTPELAEDVAILCDAVRLQGKLLAQQAQQLEKVTAELQQLRQMQAVTKVTQRMNEDLLTAASKGTAIYGYVCEIDSTTSLVSRSQTDTTSTEGSAATHGGDANASADFGNLFDLLKGARLAGAKSVRSLERIQSAAYESTTTHVAQSAHTRGTIRAAALGPAGAVTRPEGSKE